MSSDALPGAAPGAVIEAARALVAGVSDRIAAGFSDEELVEGLQALQDLAATSAAVEAVLLAEVDAREVPKKVLHWGSTADWFTHLAGLHRREGRRRVLHALQLTGERPATWAALRDGHTSPVQAGIVCDSLEMVPPSLRQEAEGFLLEQSRSLTATELVRAGRHLVEVVDPDRAERQLQAALDREERAAHLQRFLSVVDDGAGGVRIKGRGSVEDGATMRAALLPLTKPAPAADIEDPEGLSQTDPRDHGARMWDALVQLGQHALTTDLPPQCHGARPRVAVTIPLHDLTTNHGSRAAVTEDGLELSAAAVRRLACDADLIPICLGSHGEVLDVGRAVRLVTRSLWTALVCRDGHCTFPGCTRPPVMCHAHHIQHWADGGPTDLDNLVMLCGEHHRVLHHTPWQVRINPHDHQPEFLPPPRHHTHQPPPWIRHRARRE